MNAFGDADKSNEYFRMFYEWAGANVACWLSITHG
jgi:hypothetical protein